jgi:protein-S-isoprenylcysteine O-methyltransferase Ste14
MSRNDIARVASGLVIVPLFFWGFFAVAGGADWTRGWIYLGIQIAGHGVMITVLGKKNPELVRRRASFGEGTKRWDYVMLTVFGATFLATLLIAAFDAGAGWSTMESWIWWSVGLFLFGGYVANLTWSMVVNPHFEKTVRIQADRNHVVIDTGPYRFVRHPGYLGIILGFVLSAPLLLGSWWAFVPAAASVMSLIVRTILEDRTLLAELEGYEEYARRTPYRLVPGIW